MNLDNIEKLKKLFHEVKDLGWIESKYGGYGSIGTTFENLIGLSYNQFEVPDFDGIEIKTKRKYSDSYITLFNASLDGKYLFATKNVVDEYGWPNKTYRNINVLFGDVFGNECTLIGTRRKMKLDVNYNDACVYLNVYSVNNKILSYEEYCWSFALLREKLVRKLSLLAFVSVDRKFVNGKEFFKYEEIVFYKLISFEQFCKLIDQEIIRVTFRVGVRSSGKNAGKRYDHGTAFAIKETDLDKLFVVI